MKKNIYTGIFCTILGLCINTPANASIVSRNFLDQALTDYATTTALDLKANQSDITDLNTQISDSVDVLRQLLEQGFLSYELVNDIDPEKFPNTISGAFNLLHQYLNRFAGSVFYGWTDSTGTYYRGFADLNNGWTDSEGNTYLGVKGLNDKIGTLPEGITVQGMLDGWTDGDGAPANPGLKGIFGGWRIKDRYFHGLSVISDFVSMVEDAYGVIFSHVFTRGSQSTTIDGVDYTGPVYPLWKLSEGIDKIGTLPTEIPNMNSTWARYGFVETTGTPIDLPDTIGGMLAMLFNEDDSYDGLSLRNIMVRILMGFNRIEGLANLTSAYKLVGDSPIVTAVNANTAKIGTLPDGYETVGAALSAIKGIAEEAKAAALAAIPDPKTEGSNGKYVLTVDIVGDNATYRWEPIDRGDTTPTTE